MSVEPEEKKAAVLAVSGVKNSGKTTCIANVLPILKKHGLRVAVIKHDGHEFEPDVPGTDTWRLRKAGAYGTAIFSKGRFQIIQERPTDEAAIIGMFHDVDLVLLEGFKYSRYPKIEIVRSGNSQESICPADTLIAVATNIDGFDGVPAGIPIVPLDDLQSIAELMLNFVQTAGKEERA
ncbi:MAG: molybdopterin-guanine dinucleotide biosynthesis protein B [Clostridia bacterium]|nr:molybdopterin-guanine dinucleotide biosynthesis protein B [Clostridia bacterium]